ncbi:unnamed protein product [Urochloa decumbens]|uniref:Uncharacterized protein n=1 Tax=Urochloa decumbens TaxID=240449 RepID=A0ABC8VVJ8_9POAL
MVKLGKVLVGEYNLQKGVKGEMIMFLQPELESMQGALQEIANVPPDQVDNQDKIWASEVRELSYDIEDSIDTFMVRCNDDNCEPSDGPHDMKTFIYRTIGLLTSYRIRRKIATDIRGIKRRLIEVRERRQTYKIDGAVAKPATVDSRLWAHYTELVGIDDTRDELIKFLGEDDDEAPMKEGKIASILGFGGLGKTALANAVYAKIEAQFDCCGFVSVSQNPDMKKLFKALLSHLTGNNIKEQYELDDKWLIDELRGFLEGKRYFIIIDDIWDISVWKTIRFAMPDNKCGYRIITTTRVLDVAEQVGGVYHMKPLCPHNSKILLYSRIFGSADKYSNAKCPDEQLVEVSDKILKKCAGVPLAILTIASLLASKGKNKLDWFEVCNSIGVGLENSFDVENMRKILSFISYYDLPSYLRKCLLYLSVFPEDDEIDKDRLIRMWIAEDLIGYEKQGKSLFEVGETYFNELINKSMIQPVYDDYEVVIRRLCLHNSKEDHVTSETTMSMQQVRSASCCLPAAINLMPELRSFNVLRVLDLQSCYLSEAYSLKYLGTLFHLRYLGLMNTRINHLPEEIGNLKLLQTLDISMNPILSLPTSIVQLRHLTCLILPGHHTNLTSRIGGLTALEELSLLEVKDSGSTGIIEELGNLTRLRVLTMSWTTEMNESLEKSMVECLNKLRKIQRLGIFTADVECNLVGWVLPPHISKLELCYWFSMLPDWINPSLGHLRFLQIHVRELWQEDLQILGRLPGLRYLYLWVDHENLGITRRFTVGACSFPSLVECKFWEFGGSMEFRQGAMPRLKDLTFSVLVQDATDLGLGNLQSLQTLGVSLISGGASEEEVEQVKAAKTAFPWKILIVLEALLPPPATNPRMAQVQGSPPWTDLPPELLGLVFLRLPTRADRAFFPAVCRAWCSASRQCRLPLPSPVPWLVLPGGNAISFPHGKTFQLLEGVRYHNSCGEWLLLSRDDGSCF